MSDLFFIVSSVLLGAGLAMDAFSVSMANGLNEPEMRRRKRLLIAGVFGGFQGLMPLLGWLAVHTIVEIFSAFSRFVPLLGFILLLFVGGKMLMEGIWAWNDDEVENEMLKKRVLFVQAIATSIDALSIGFTIADYSLIRAFICALIIAAITFGLCIIGLRIGRYFGVKLAGKASVIGGLILIGIAIKLVVGLGK
ncbi:MAG: manganese efflux pump [Eubacterium sp.]|nr:manganese efflux pump [Eubacterium sp.]